MSAILGISAYHGDAAAALLVDGRLVAAVAEERLTRIKHCAGFPGGAVRACLEMAGLGAEDVEHFAVGRDPRAHWLRKAAFALRRRPGPRLISDRVANASLVAGTATALAESLGLDAGRVRWRLHRVEHHPAHQASAFFVSPFDSAAVCAVDGFGDFVSTSWAMGRGPALESLGRVHFPHSLGLFYLAVTQYLGFLGYGDEYKVMGLASFGAPEYAPLLRRIIHLGPDGHFQLDLGFFRHCSRGVSMTWEAGAPVIGPVYTPRLEALLGPARRPDEPIEPRHEAVAASLQTVFEEVLFHVLEALQRRTRATRLCLAGGCALNSVANGKVCARTGFRELFVQPAASDDGTALGAALYVEHQLRRGPRRFVLEHAGWGPGFDDASIRAALARRRPALAGQRVTVREIDDEEVLCGWAAERIAQGAVVGWFQGRMEWGPRALGNRSILADPRRPEMREIINTRIKRRERFRPFAPSILEEALDDYFVNAAPDPFMLRVHPVRPARRAVIPAVTHVDGSGRVHTVSRQNNPRFWQLLKAFDKLTGVPVLLNTSFNENEPIVLRPEEALDCFLRTGMDALVLGRTVVAKAATERGGS